MGARRNIKIIYQEGDRIYFYTHWDAEELEDILKNALIRGKDRWDDEGYLARIIFSEMIKEDIEGTTGYGISPYECDPQYETIVVNLNENTVNGKSFEDFIS